jgi:hypothetical protein
LRKCHAVDTRDPLMDLEDSNRARNEEIKKKKELA